MYVRYYIDPVSDAPHIYNHDVSEPEVEDILAHPLEDRPGRDGSRIAIGQAGNGRFFRVVYIPDAEPDSVFVITAYELRGKTAGSFSPPQTQEISMKQSKFPPGWNKTRVQNVLAHYEGQTEEQAVAEDEAAFENPEQTFIEIPNELLPTVRELIARRNSASNS